MQNNEKAILVQPFPNHSTAKVKAESTQNATKMVKSDTYFTTNRGRGMDTKQADRQAIIDIAAEMQDKEGFAKCLDIEIEATKHGISKPTFYRRLTELTRDGILEKKEISHKDIRYHVSFQHMPKEQAKVLRFKQYALMKINAVLESVAQKNDEQELLKELSKWIGALSLYCLLKQIETGIPYTDAVMYYLTQPGGAPKYLRAKIVYSSGVIWTLDKDFGKLAKAMTDEPLGTHEQFKPRIAYLFEVMQNLYQMQFDEFNLMMGEVTEEVDSGRPAYEPAEETKKPIEANMRTDDEKQKPSSTKKPARAKGQFYSHPKYGPSNLKAESDSQKKEDQGKTEE